MVQLFMPPAGFDVATQMEVLQSTQVVKDTYKNGGVTPGTVKLDVKQVAATDVIEYKAESNDPEAAEKFALQLPETYRLYMAGNRKVEVANALKFAIDRLAEETTKLNFAEHELQQFRSGSGVLSTVDDGRKAKLQEFTDAQAEIYRIQTDVAAQRAKLDALIAERRKLPEFVETPTTITNPQIEVIRASIAALKTTRSGLLILSKPNNTKVQEVDAQIKDMEDRLVVTPPTVTTISSTRNLSLQTFDDKISEARTNLRGAYTQGDKANLRLQRARLNLGHFSAVEIKQQQLEAEVQRHTDSIPLYAKSVDDLTLRDKATHDPVQVIAPAQKAVQIAPKKMNNIIYSAIVGLVLGFCLAMLQEYLDDRINVPDEARRLLQAPVLGYVPMVEREDSRLLSHTRGGSLLESYRVLRTNVRFAAVDTSTMTLLVSSTVPGEGKSVTAANLAVAMALDGLKVILVDCDLRRPTLHDKFETEQRPGVTNVLVEHTTLDEAIKETGIPGLRLLTAGPIPPNPAELLNSRAMHQLHQDLKTRADVVIYDSPPFLATADAQILSSEVDGILYVVQFGEAKKSAVRHAAEMIEQTRSRVLGIVFNKIDLSNKRDDYYYGYYNYYSYYSSNEIEDGQPRKKRHREWDAITSNGNGHGKGLTDQDEVVMIESEDEEELA